MYDYIKGTLVKITAKYIVIEANGDVYKRQEHQR